MNKLWNLYRKKIDETQHLAGFTKGGTNAREAGIVPPVVTPRPLKMCENQERTGVRGGHLWPVTQRAADGPGKEHALLGE